MCLSRPVSSESTVRNFILDLWPEMVMGQSALRGVSVEQNGGKRTKNMTQMSKKTFHCRNNYEKELLKISSTPDDPVIWILLMGRNISGKSSSGHNIKEEKQETNKNKDAEINVNSDKLQNTHAHYLQNHVDLWQLVNEHGGKFHCFNNKKEKLEQIKEVQQKTEGMMENSGRYISRSDSMDSLLNFSAEDPDETDVIPERKDQIRLVLLGKTGAGKNATGNTSIGQNVFELLAKYNLETSESINKIISVIDNKLCKEEIKSEISHDFITVIRVGRLTEEEKTVEKWKVFGEQMEKYIEIISYHDKENQIIEEFVKECDPDLRKYMKEVYNNMFLCLDDDESARFTLIKITQKMEEENGGMLLTNQETHEKKLDKDIQFKQKHKRVHKTERQKIYWSLEETETEDGFEFKMYDPDCEQSWYSQDERLIADPSDPQKLIDPGISVSSDRLVTFHCVKELRHEIRCDTSGLRLDTIFRVRNKTAATPNSDDLNEVTPDLQRSGSLRLKYQIWWILMKVRSDRPRLPACVFSVKFINKRQETCALL